MLVCTVLFVRLKQSNKYLIGCFCFQVICGLNSSVVKSRRFCSILEDNILINSHGKIDLFFIQYPNHLSNEVSGIGVGACPSRYRTKRKVHSATHTHTIHSCPYTHLQFRGTNQCSIALHVSNLQFNTGRSCAPCADPQGRVASCNICAKSNMRVQPLWQLLRKYVFGLWAHADSLQKAPL